LTTTQQQPGMTSGKTMRIVVVFNDVDLV